MSLVFSGNSVDFSTTLFSSLTSYSILAWIKINSYNASSSRFVRIGELSTSKLVYFGLNSTASELLFFSRPNGTSNPGLWTTTTDPAPVNTNIFCAATYDNSSLSNDPIIYVNGASQSISESSAPLTNGTLPTSNYISLSSTGTNAFDGTIHSLLLYNRILSAAEIADAYASKLAIPTYKGLVFAPNLMGASGGVVDGATLGTSNKIVDFVSGSIGTPSGSPVLRSETHLVME